MVRDLFKENRKELNRVKRHLTDAKEALEFLLNSFETIAKPRVQYKRVRAALQMAISALEKQIPKRVVNNRCPECGRIVGFSHCERCGQRLEW